MHVMPLTKRISATEVKTHFGRIVREVATTDTPVIIQTHGEDQAVLISVQEFRKLRPAEEEESHESERECVRTALRAVGLLSEHTPIMRQRAAAYDARHARAEQKQLLTELRSLDLDPSLSQVILENRAWFPADVEPVDED